MRARWDDVNARARGLGSRLLSQEALARLRSAGDLQRLSRALAELGVLPEEIPNATAAALELGLRRSAGHALAIARRWLGARAEVVAVAMELEDRRSLRALVRGAAAGVRADARLAGLIPTPALPERLLVELAERSQVREQAALLVAAGHPYGAPMLAAAAAQEPDLYAVELAIARTFAARAVHGARRGGRFLRDYVGDLIDLDNCRTALFLSSRETGEPSAPAFLPGGHRLTLTQFERAAMGGDPVEVARRLARALDGETAALLVRHAGDPAALDDALDIHRGEALRREARLDPLGPAPFLHYCHRLRAQTSALDGLVWSVELGVPVTRRAVAGAGAEAE